MDRHPTLNDLVLVLKEEEYDFYLKQQQIYAIRIKKQVRFNLKQEETA